MDNQDNIIVPPIVTPTPEHHFSKTLMVVIVLVLVGAISAGAYFGIFTPKNKVTLGQAVVNTLTDVAGDKINSGAVSGSFKFTAKDVDKNYSDLATDPTSRQVVSQIKDISVNLKYAGIFNKNSKGEPETSGNLSLSIKNPNGGTIGMFPAQDMNLEYKVFTDTIYLNVKTLPSLASMMLPPTVDTSKYLNQWFSSPNVSPEITATTTMTVEMKKIILDLFDNSGAFKVVDQKAEKTEGGTSVTALYIEIDLDKFGDAIIRLGKDLDKGVALSKAEEMEIRTNIEKFKELPER
jgi:hypothetical protein